MAKTITTPAKPLKAKRLLVVSPDTLDFRDRMYAPSINRSPAATLRPPPAAHRPVLDQGGSQACTGFALATCIHILLSKRDEGLTQNVSPFMLYSLARRYDSLTTNDARAGSTCRGALKAWFKHGVCGQTLWRTLEEPKLLNAGSAAEWWNDGAARPLGAYYRVDPRSVTDMQVALNEVGALFASALTHSGWLKIMRDAQPRTAVQRAVPREIPIIPFVEKDTQTEGGHAFAIVGYNDEGFIVQNTWGKSFGRNGLAVLSYADWSRNGYDCWVAQLGVVTKRHSAAAANGYLKTQISAGDDAGSLLAVHNLSPFIVNTENDGELSNSGQFHTTEQNVREIGSVLIPAYRKKWGHTNRQKTDVVLYAHGGLVDEKTAAKAALRWIPKLRDDLELFPIFFMWESGLIDTICNEIAEEMRKRGDTPTAGVLDRLDRWWSDRIEPVGRFIGKGRWDEMKENAQLLSSSAAGGAALTVNALIPHKDIIRIHLVGHSAGSIIHCHLAQRIVAAGLAIESVSFMAPAVRTDMFENTLLPLIEQGSVKRYLQFHLNDGTEDNEGQMRLAFLYKRSLLYMVSNGLESPAGTPILGMEKHFVPKFSSNAKLAFRSAPNTAASNARTHGGFDDDSRTMDSVIAHILGKTVP